MQYSTKTDSLVVSAITVMFMHKVENLRMVFVTHAGNFKENVIKLNLFSAFTVLQSSFTGKKKKVQKEEIKLLEFADI